MNVIGCTSCTGETSNITMPCNVCELVDKDVTPKMVWWCDLCEAYICKECLPNDVKRIKAAAISKALWLKDKALKLFKHITG